MSEIKIYFDLFRSWEYFYFQNNEDTEGSEAAESHGQDGGNEGGYRGPDRSLAGYRQCDGGLHHLLAHLRHHRSELLHGSVPGVCGRERGEVPRGRGAQQDGLPQHDWRGLGQPEVKQLKYVGT